MAVKLSVRPLVPKGDFHFEYALKNEELVLEGVPYIGIGVTAKMVDTHGNEFIEYVRDVTTDPHVAQRLIRQLVAFRVSPMCLRMFVEDFLACL